MKATELKHILDGIQTSIDKLMAKISNIENAMRGESMREEVSDNEVLEHGDKYGYFILRDEEDIADFRDLVYFIKSHPERFNQREVDYAGYTDKSFEDIRLSKFAVGIMRTAYKKMHHGDDWPLQFEPITMYKYKNRILWVNEGAPVA